MSLLKETINFYKEKKRFERERKILLNSQVDLGFLERFIKKINDNPNLVVKVKLADGTSIELSTFTRKVKRDFREINGVSDLNEILIQ